MDKISVEMLLKEFKIIFAVHRIMKFLCKQEEESVLTEITRCVVFIKMLDYRESMFLFYHKVKCKHKNYCSSCDLLNKAYNPYLIAHKFHSYFDTLEINQYNYFFFVYLLRLILQ